ncbi:MAG: phosphoglycerate kinase [Rhodospirillales bacterium]
MSGFNTIDDLDVKGKTVLVRADLNVPMQNGVISDDTRIRRFVPTAKDLAAAGAKVVILSHFGRPKGKVDPANSLKPLAGPLSEALGAPVAFGEDCIGTPARAVIGNCAPGGFVLLENLRFHGGEEANDNDFADALAELGDIFVNDGFSVSHRAHASVEGLARRLPNAAGRLMQTELDALQKALGNPERPVCAIVGGSKVSTKLDLLGNLVGRVDKLVIGGGMANTFLAALGTDVGKSLCEHEMLDTARAIMGKADAAGCEIVLPRDAVVAATLAEGVETDVVEVGGVPSDRMILDVGPMATASLCDLLETCKTLVWNGPLGAFEFKPFDEGTNAVARKAAELTRDGKLLSVAGGGDTVSALATAGVQDHFTYVSSAGGAFLEWLEGKTLPGVAALER